MNRTSRTVRISIILTSLAMLIGCSEEGAGPATPEETQNVVVRGEVTRIQDNTDVDGGIALDIELEDNGSERLILGSLFTVPPPSEDHLRLYDVVRRVELGDIVRAEGVRKDHGIILEELWIVDGRP
jgi:hypothetical protein